MNIYDARSMLGLFCYRAGYFPAALVQWTRIPEPNRALRPEIEHLLKEVENRLALEQQETQPMRRDQILRQPPIISGNLPPADLPNPHEPIRSEETFDSHRNWVAPGLNGDDNDDEERQPTSPLHINDIVPSSNGHSNNDHVPSPESQTSPPVTQRKWLNRLLRLTPDTSKNG